MVDPFSLAQLAPLLSAPLIGEDASFDSVSINSREIKAGALFVAIAGENFDGHDYAVMAQEAGATAVMVEHLVEGVNIPQLLVANTRKALSQLSALNRDRFAGAVIGVTGSAGKTTVKEFIAAILSTEGLVLATKGNLNNELGVPLTLLELSTGHKNAVIEMGASEVGEIAYSVSLVKPRVVVITNASNAHVGRFGGLDKVIEAKGEILEGLSDGGVAILNLDDPSFEIWKKRAGTHKVISFSIANPKADFYATDFERNENGCQSFTLHSPAGEQIIELNVLGQHNIGNALAAAAATYAVGMELAQIKQGLNHLLSVKGRTNALFAKGGARIIDDTYNASPASVKAAIDVLSEFKGRKVLVLGDMGELGEWAERIHQETGQYAKTKVDAFYAVGPLMANATEAFGEAAYHFKNKEELSKALLVEDDVNVTILIKGSRGMAMETLVAAFGGSVEGIH